MLRTSLKTTNGLEHEIINIFSMKRDLKIGKVNQVPSTKPEKKDSNITVSFR